MAKTKRVRLYDEPLPSQTLKLLERAEAAHYWQMLAYVDVVKELNPIKVACCRFCYGQDHDYQFTLNEMREARRKHLFQQMRVSHEKRVPFDEQGGDGYTTNKKAHPDCPECHGDGINVLVPIDFDKLSPAARMLYNGIKIFKDGSMELKLRERDRAMENLQRILGFVEVDRPRELENFDELPDDVLDKAVDNVINRGLVSLEDLRTESDKLPKVVEDVEYSKSD